MVEINNNQTNTSKHHRLTTVMFTLVLVFGGVYLYTQRNTNPINKVGETPIASAFILPPSKPSELIIEKIGVKSTFEDLGLNEDKTLEVPKDANKIGWYTKGPTPGELGPSVIVGHKDAPNNRKAIFFRLGELDPGDIIEVKREDGTIAKFEVNSVETHSQDNFPTEKVYGDINHAGLRLITCAGKWLGTKGNYSDNLVVYASLVK
jgi:hypothetical protein